MRIDIISAVPELLDSPLNHSILKRAKEKGLVEIFVHSLRDYTDDKHRRWMIMRLDLAPAWCFRLSRWIMQFRH